MIPLIQPWPDDFAQRYREAGYWSGEDLIGFFRRHADTSPGQPAILTDGSRWSYEELDRRAGAIAAGLLAAGFRSGDRVVVQLPNIPEFFSIVFALFRAGLCPVFALPAHRRYEIVHFARAAEARGYVTIDRHGGFDYRTLAEELENELDELRVVVVGDADRWIPYGDLESAAPVSLPDPDPSSVAFLQLSGGSTGVSKLIPRTHDDYAYTLRESARICGLTSSSVYLAALPVGHNFPMSSPGTLGTFYAGGTVSLTLSPSPDAAFAAIERDRATITGVVPPVALLWMDAAPTTSRDLSSLEVLQVGGARFAPEAARRVEPTLNVRLQQVFGMAEGLVNYTRLDDPLDVRVHTQGRPISRDDEILLVDGDGEAVDEGEPGHLLTRGPYTIRAYHNAPDANLEAFTDDGYYRTGDLVSRTPEGNLVVHGRISDLINRGGEKVPVEEVENLLLRHEGIHDAVLIGIPDEFLGERTCAVAIPRQPEPKPAELRAWIRKQGLATYKVPDRIVFVPSFPATGVGKVSRRELRAAVREQVEANS